MVDRGDNLKKNSSSQIKAEDQVNKANVLPLINSLNVSIQGNDDTVFRRQSSGLLAKNRKRSFTVHKGSMPTSDLLNRDTSANKKLSSSNPLISNGHLEPLKLGKERNDTEESEVKPMNGDVKQSNTVKNLNFKKGNFGETKKSRGSVHFAGLSINTETPDNSKILNPISGPLLSPSPVALNAGQFSVDRDRCASNSNIPISRLRGSTVSFSNHTPRGQHLLNDLKDTLSNEEKEKMKSEKFLTLRGYEKIRALCLSCR